MPQKSTSGMYAASACKNMCVSCCSGSLAGNVTAAVVSALPLCVRLCSHLSPGRVVGRDNLRGSKRKRLTQKCSCPAPANVTEKIMRRTRGSQFLRNIAHAAVGVVLCGSEGKSGKNIACTLFTCSRKRYNCTSLGSLLLAPDDSIYA